MKYAIAITCLFAAQPAFADWQYTRWGMSAQALVKAANGAAAISAGDPKENYPSAKIGASGTHKSGSYEFTSKFYFSDAKLSVINLRLVSENPSAGLNALKNTMDGLYGKSFSEARGPLAKITYHDTTNNNRIDLVNFLGQYVYVEYRPLRDLNSSGL